MGDVVDGVRAFGAGDVSEAMIGWKVRYEYNKMILFTTIKAVRVVGGEVCFILSWITDLGPLIGADVMLKRSEYKSLPGADWHKFGVEVDQRCGRGGVNLN